MTGDRSHARIEESIARIESVSTARLVEDAQGRITALHVTPAAGWPETTVRRDVQATLLQRFDLDLPDELLHLDPSELPRRRPAAAGRGTTTEARGGTATAAPPATNGAAHDTERLVLDTVHLALRSQGTSVGVDLLDGDERLRGTTGPVGATSVLTGVVEATLHALRTRITHDLSTVVAEVVEAGGDQIAIATVIASDGRSRQRLTGSALVRGNVEDAMARATLDATNRLVTD